MNSKFKHIVVEQTAMNSVLAGFNNPIMASQYASIVNDQRRKAEDPNRVSVIDLSDLSTGFKRLVDEAIVLIERNHASDTRSSHSADCKICDWITRARASIDYYARM